jgi:hypothetical protein
MENRSPWGSVLVDERVPENEVWFYSGRVPPGIELPFGMGTVLRHPDFRLTNVGRPVGKHDWIPKAPPG